MSRSPMSSIAVLGALGAVALVMMLMMSLSGLSDPRAAGLSKEVHKSLARSLDEDPTTTKLTMRREGPEGAKVRNYTLRIAPSKPVAANEQAVGRLLLRAAELVNGKLGNLPDAVRLRCVATLPGGRGLEVRYRRVRVDERNELEVAGPLRRIELDTAKKTP